MQLYGVLPRVGGRISLSYTVDSVKRDRSVTYPSGTVSDGLFRLLVDTGPLDSGTHTVTVTLTGAEGMALIVDYILYSPGFDTIGDLDQRPPASLAPSSSSAGVITSNGASGSRTGSQATVPIVTGTGTGTGPGSTTVIQPGTTITQSGTTIIQPGLTTVIPQTSAGDSTLATNSSVPESVSSAGRSNVGAIAGGVVGGVGFLILVAVLLLWRARRRRRLDNDAGAHPGVDPYTSMSLVIQLKL